MTLSCRHAFIVFASVAIFGCKSVLHAPSRSAATESGQLVIEDTETYDRCVGQPPKEELQRAPSLFVNMNQCRDNVSRFVSPLSRYAQDGVVNDDGNCSYPNGVTCHYHTGKEFLEDTTANQRRGVGELHCIVPSDEPESPLVVGAHIRCRPGTQPPQAPDGKRAIGQACEADLLAVFSQCNDWNCCDDGTLTNPVERLNKDQRALEPDFRMCSADPLEVDCRWLIVLDGHVANAPALGGIHSPIFTPAMVVK